jgi:acyl carrier protein
LADFKVPRWIRIVEEIPKNSLGKLQRTGLAARLGISAVELLSAPEREYVAPRTEEEAILAAIWRGVLRVDRVGILDDFFRLGGDSILATRILSQVRSAFNVELSTIALFETSTLEDMAAAIEAALSGDPDKATPALEPIRRRG